MFDEIEKAHPDVLNILLQILDDGRITDAQGRTVNFENTIIVMTSNAGSDRTDTLMGFGKTREDASKEKAIKALEDFLRPEFLGRVDEVVVFAPLKKESLKKIAGLMLDELKEAMLQKDIEVSYTEGVCQYLAEKGDGAKEGARILRNMIRREIENEIVNIIIDKGEEGVKEIQVDFADSLVIKAK